MILATGGLGYIGSHVVKHLVNSGEKLVILDDMSKGHMIGFRNCATYVGDYGDRELVEYICGLYDVDTILHFAAQTTVTESVKDPEFYYRENIGKSLDLINAARKKNVNKFIFSSSATIFDNPSNTPITEEHPKNAINAYGQSKLMFERILQDYDKAYNFRSISFRYFNASGADLSGELGEDHNPEYHLIPTIMKVALGQLESINIYGFDYPTKDGTAVRDYVHVLDIAQAYSLGVKALRSGCQTNAYNLGNSTGYSVLDVVKMVEEVTGKKIPYKMQLRRQGDLPTTIASSEKAKKELKWEPKYSDLKTIIETAWKWHQSHPNGFQKDVRVV